MAETMGRVSASFHPKFVLSAGGNFLPAGMPGAWWRDARALSDGYRRARRRACAVPQSHAALIGAGTGIDNPNDVIRMGATFNDVFAPDSLQVPWYITGGTPDWQGNISGARLLAARMAQRAACPRERTLTLQRSAACPAELSFNGSSYTNDRWNYPSRYYSFEYSVPIGGDTVQFIMIDTESLIGGLNQMPEVMPPLFYPPPAARRSSSRRLLQTAFTGAATSAFTMPATGAAADPYAAAAGVDPYAAPAGVDPYAAPAGVDPYAAAGGVDPYAAAGATVFPMKAAGAATTFAFNPAVLAPPTAAEVAAAAAEQAAAQAAATASAASMYTFTPPPVDEVQWNWLQGQLNSSTSDWIIVVGYHPIWSAGSWGPTWPLVERLVPMMETAGAALYVSGTDHLMQHFTAVPSWTNVDFIVIGNGAYAMPPGTTATEAMPHSGDCPDGGLQFSYGATSGFATIQVTTAGPKQPSTLHVNFFNANDTMLYTFFKENPRTIPGHTAGDLRSPPAPGHGAATGAASYDSQPVVIMGGAFLVVAVLLCLIGAASHARRQIMYMSALRGGRAVPGDPRLSEQTPLMLGKRGAK
jgi:hypothetical protein